MKQMTFLSALLLISSSLLAQVRIVVLSPSDDIDLIERWAVAEGVAMNETATSKTFRDDDAGVSILAPKSDVSLSVVASTLFKADVAVIVLDTTEGPLPVNRDHIIIARQANVPVVAIMLANVDQLYALTPQDAQELLDLEESEIRDVLALYEVGGPDTLLFHDSARSANAPLTASGGLREAGTVFSKLGISRAQQPQPDTQRSAQAQVYLLTDAEAGGNGITISGPALLEMWSEGSSAAVEISSDSLVGAGEFANVAIRSPDAFLGQYGSQMLLLKNGNVVGLGVLTEVSTY